MKATETAGGGMRKFRTIDVRPMMARDESPFPAIMAAVKEIKSGEGLCVVSPFLPSPLIERMQGGGFKARPERRADGSWGTFFWKE